LRGLLSRTDRKGDSKLGYNSTASLFICWQIQKEKKVCLPPAECMEERNCVYTFCGFRNQVMKEFSNRMLTADFENLKSQKSY
jgi:hypothetical protein